MITISPTRLLDGINNLIFPKSSRVLRLEAMSPDSLLTSLPKSTLSTSNVSCIFKYQSNRVKELVWEIKYKRNAKLLSSIGELMYERIQSFGEEFCIISVPQNKMKVYKRGFNQSEELVKAIQEKDMQKNFIYRTDLLKKVRKTARQNSLKSREARSRNLVDSFRCTDQIFASGKIFVLVDDVYTTGTTISEIRKVLIQAGARKVIGLTVAH